LALFAPLNLAYADTQTFLDSHKIVIAQGSSGAGGTNSSSSSTGAATTFKKGSTAAGGQPDSSTNQKQQSSTSQQTTKPGEVPLPSSDKYSLLPSLKKTPSEKASPVGMLNEFVGGIIKNLKFLIAAVAVLFIIIAAVKLIIAGDNEDVITKQKTAITYAILGLAVLGFADEMGKVLSVACPEGATECAKGGFLSSPSAMIEQSSIFNRTVKIFITFIKYLIGGIAVLMLVRNGIRFVALAGNEESVTLDKKNIAFTSIGLILIIIASTVIDKVFYVLDTSTYPGAEGVEPAINPERGVQEIAGITNFVVSFTAPIAILVLIAGGIMYATAGGNEDTMNKAKRMMLLAVIGMALIYGAFAIVSTVIIGRFSS
jgi:hypothetical protein